MAPCSGSSVSAEAGRSSRESAFPTTVISTREPRSNLDFVALSDLKVVEIVWRATVAELALVLLLVLHVIGLRFSRGVAERRRQRIIGLWRPRLLDALEEQPDARLSIRDADAPTVLLLWNEHQSLLQGESRERLIEFATRVGLSQAARRLLRRGRLRNRLIAVAALGNLRDRSAWHDLQSLVRDPNPYVSLAAAKAMMRIDAEAATPTIVELLARRVEWSPARVAAMLREVETRAISPALAAEAVRPLTRNSPRFVRLLELCYPQDALPAARDILDHATDDEVLCACLHVLGQFRDSDDLERVRRLMDHPSANVRIRAVTVLGAIADLEHWAEIARLLSDPEWWVRYRAAQALAGLPGMQTRSLLEVRDQQTDRFARDILDHVIAEAALR